MKGCTSERISVSDHHDNETVIEHKTTDNNVNTKRITDIT